MPGTSQETASHPTPENVEAATHGKSGKFSNLDVPPKPYTVRQTVALALQHDPAAHFCILVSDSEWTASPDLLQRTQANLPELN
ncbi:hypothetical protein M378DRAFT_18581 [Amanita muscaria Koide BX008]|uniref:Uncharacterized protein n=1 Tax=Amanita muscaria (strain Koide BX008) TaxID=946122 RepID=A0A0C2WF62_AMAMK|nr:hypothetical protein M378DRAFT_18581 [Amanita muscaria Koide BX008]